MLRFLLIIFYLLEVTSLRVCVVGGSSALGREIIYQGLNDFNYQMLGVTDSPNKVCIPYRGSGLDDKSKKQKILSNKLQIVPYSENPKKYDAIIFTIGGSAFEKSDYSDKITEKYLENISKTCKSIVLISAYGVGNSIKNANFGIVSMRNWYLKDVYRAKERQEELINNFEMKNINKKIYRPKVLSYGETSFESTPRQELAKEILDNLFL